MQYKQVVYLGEKFTQTAIHGCTCYSQLMSLVLIAKGFKTLTGIFYLTQHPFYLEVTTMTVTNATRKLDPCGQYKEHRLEDLVLACGILPTHIDENNPESLMTQVARICNTVPEQHIVREAIHMDEDGVVYGDDQSIKYFPLAAITRNVGERFEELFIHNGGQMIVRESGDGAVVHYAVVINN